MECSVTGKIKMILWPSNTVATNNLLKHIKSGKTDKIQAMVKRGSLKIKSV